MKILSVGLFVIASVASLFFNLGQHICSGFNLIAMGISLNPHPDVENESPFAIIGGGIFWVALSPFTATLTTAGSVVKLWQQSPHRSMPTQ